MVMNIRVPCSVVKLLGNGAASQEGLSPMELVG
jgi:hypothetical protein